MVTMPGTSKREFACSNLRWIPTIGLAWLLYISALLWMAVYGPSATERPLVLELFLKIRGISYRFRVSISSRYDLSIFFAGCCFDRCLYLPSISLYFISYLAVVVQSTNDLKTTSKEY